MTHLRFALRKARAHVYDGYVQFHLCAVITRGGKVLSVGFNRSIDENAASVMHPHIGKAVLAARRDTNNYNIHAEMDAIERLPDGVDPSGCKMHVARIRLLDLEPRIARPCIICENVLYRFGIRKIYYTLDPESYGIMSIKRSGVTRDRVFSGSM